MNKSLEYRTAAKIIKSLADAEQNPIARQALIDAQSRLVIKMAEELIMECTQAKTLAA